MDRQTLLVRRAIAAAAALVALVLLVLLFRGCLNAREERAIKDYVQDVDSLVEESNQQGEALFGLLTDPGDQTEVDIQNSLNGFRVQAEQLVERARGTEPPDELVQAQRFLVETLEFRRDGLGAVAEELPKALGDEGRREATERIAAQMQNFLTSDVVYSQRVVPNLQGALRDEDLAGEVEVAKSRFLPDIEWLDPSTVADRVSRIRGGGGAAEDAAPGLHGTGLGTVSAGTQALAQGGTTNVTLSDDLSFRVQVVNQGENDEQDVTVRLSLKGTGEPIELEGRVEEIAQGQTETATIPLEDPPPTGERVTVDLEVEPVPGEEKTDNNKGTYTVIFTR